MVFDGFKRCTVVIPVYKETPTESEWMSFQQILQVLGHYPISLLTHENLSLHTYTKELTKQNIPYSRNHFSSNFFSGIPGYNALLLSPEFYNSYSDSEFILIYQLDAWVFRDELEAWCSIGYDYIGAPWFSHFSTHGKLWGVGNGGFSLRKIRASLHVLKVISDLRITFKSQPEQFGNQFADDPFLRQILVNYLTNDPHNIQCWKELNNEDHLWGLLAPRITKMYSIPTPQEAIAFAFECSPAQLYELNRFKLPFGCHAWEKYDPAFWDAHIPKMGASPQKLQRRIAILQKIQAADIDADAESLGLLVGEYLDTCIDDNEVRNLYREYEEKHFRSLEMRCTRFDTKFRTRKFRVSCMVSTYASAEFFKECLEDLERQTIFQEMEIIVIDACSPEGELEIAKPFLEKHDNIRYYRTPERIGIYPAWTFGSILAQAPYIIPFSANDRLLPEAFEILAETLDQNPVSELAYGDSYLTDKPHQEIGSHSPAAFNGGYLRWPEITFGWLLVNCGVGPHPMWRKNVHESIGYFDRRYKATGDQDFFLRVARRGGLIHLPRFTGMAWLTDDSLSGKPSAYAETFNIQVSQFRSILSMLPLQDRTEIWKLFFKRYDELITKLPLVGCEKSAEWMRRKHGDFFARIPQ